jgi:sugar/nucleoside kinase (ribokinase family)
MKKVVGIGNALVDLIMNLKDDSFLTGFALEKGSMTLIDRQKMNAVLEMGGALNLGLQKASGGSAANTIHGLAQLGVPVGYIGKIGDDDYGAFFRSYMEQGNICATLFKGKADSGKSMILVSPDFERTMATYLGAAIELDASD